MTFLGEVEGASMNGQPPIFLPGSFDSVEMLIDEVEDKVTK
jgi:hypothetical protein